MVSTHSRLKAAGEDKLIEASKIIPVSTHSRLKAAGLFGRHVFVADLVSTHSRLKAAGILQSVILRFAMFQHTAA